jgi:hypothetical protein
MDDHTLKLESADDNCAKPPLSRKSSHRVFSEKEKEKIAVIQAACESGNRELVVELSILCDGLVSDEARKQACMSVLSSFHLSVLTILFPQGLSC